MTRELHIDPSAHSAITAPPPPPDDPAEALVGRIVAGRYEIKRVLGRGGMGVVLLGEHLELEKRVAIKVLLASYARDAESLKRFEREARSAAKLGHTNIVGTLDLGRLETGEPFLVMEHVDGTDLVPLLGAVARGETTHERVLGLLDQIAAALDAVHGAGIVHRDVKAENILLTKGHDGRDLVKLVDFGLAALADAEKRGARLTKVGMVIGTPEYLAPECARGALGGPTADQYSLAVLAFELFWGEPPITSSNPMELLMAKVSADAPLLSSVTGRPSPLLDAALARGLERDPSRRYASCAELVAAVRRGVEELTALPLVRSKPPPARSLRSERTRRPPTATSAAPTGNETLVLPRTPQPSGEVERPPTRGGAGWIVGALLLALLIVGTGAGVALWPRGDDTPGPAPAPPPVAPTVPLPAPVARVVDPPAPVARDTTPRGVTPPADPPARTPSPHVRTAPASAEAPTPALPAPELPTQGPAPETPPLAPAEPEPARERAPVARVERATPTTSAEPLAAEQGGPTAPELVRSAQGSLLRGQVAEARDLFREATRVSARHAPAWRGLGVASEQLHEIPEARRAFERYLEIAPDAPDAETIRGRLTRLGG